MIVFRINLHSLWCSLHMMNTFHKFLFLILSKILIKFKTRNIINNICFIFNCIFHTKDFLVSIDNNVLGNFFLNFLYFLTLCHSIFGEIIFDPGLVDSPPISIISAPDLSFYYSFNAFL